MVKKLNNILEEKSPQSLTQYLEVLVALLRNKDQAKEFDVECYFKDYFKLQRKLMKLEPLEHDLERVKRLSNELNQLKPAFLKDFPEFKCFAEWADNWCPYAIESLNNQA